MPPSEQPEPVVREPYHQVRQGPDDVYRLRETAQGWVVVSARGKQVFGPEPEQADAIRAFRTDPDYGEALALLSDD